SSRATRPRPTRACCSIRRTALVRSEGVTGYPAAYLIDQKGIIRMAFSGWGEETARKWYEGPPFASEIVHDGRTASLFDPGARTFLPLDGSVSLPERTG